MIKISELLKKPTGTLLVVFFNTDILNNNNYKIVSRFKKTKWSNEQLNDKYYESTRKSMSDYFGLDFSLQNNSKEIFLEINNENNINYDEFINLLYFEIITRISNSIDNYEKDLMMGIFSMRGSIDINGQFYTVDARLKSENHLDKMFKLILNSEKLFDYLNLNFREFQNQFSTGKHRRDTQIRIDLGWFYTFNSYLKEINKYRSNALDYQADIMHKINPPKISEAKKRAYFIDRINFYRKNVFGKELTKKETEILRKSLFGDTDEKTATRNQRIRLYIQESTPDICVGCKNEYDIKDRSFIMPFNGNHWYMEINHIIAFSNDREQLDVPENLIKLCPVCHRALTPNRATNKLQKQIIHRMIYKSRPEIKEFVEKVAYSKKAHPIDYVFGSLK